MNPLLSPQGLLAEPSVQPTPCAVPCSASPGGWLPSLLLMEPPPPFEMAALLPPSPWSACLSPGSGGQQASMR